jgi:DNA-binding protein
MDNEFHTNPIIRPHSAINEIYIGRKKPLSVYYARVEKLLDQGIKEIIVHSTGMAIPAALDLCNKIKPFFIRHIIQTSSVQVIDEINRESKIRTIPALHIAFYTSS